MYTLIFTESYTKRARRFLQKHPAVVQQYEKVLTLLEHNPHHPSLRLHALRGKLKGLASVSINLQYRITLQLIIHEQQIVLVDVGTHDQVYL